MFEWKAYIYILTNNTHTVLYTWVTTGIYRRIHQHRQKVYSKSFTSRYQCDKLIFFYGFDNLCDAIETEKKIKKRNRDKKRNLIWRYNPNRDDLFEKGGPSTRNLIDSRLASGWQRGH